MSGEDNKFKFDVVIGNPPYQEESSEKISKNGQKPRTNIFQNFQLQADKLAKQSISLIYPGKRWLHQSGKGMRKFGLEQVNDPHLEKIIYYPDATEVFPNVDITDGVTIVEKSMFKENDSFDFERIKGGTVETVKVTHPGNKLLILDPKLILISQKIQKVVSKNELGYLFDSVYPRTLFGIESNFIEENKKYVTPYRGQKILDNELKLFTNDKSGSAGRADWFVVNKSLLTKSHDLVGKYKVVVSSAHPGGQNNRDNQLSILDNKSIFGRSRVALKLFDSQSDAKHFYDYMKSNFIRFTLLLTGEALSSFAKWTPDILDYSENSVINWESDIDTQLFDMFNISESEKQLINKEVQDSETKGNIKDENTNN